ncbi:unnamed protein product [Rangifer tarandus platyrhynchus]|uniref:Uncharacterized protein n=1 Tax=Rangifer tarandus platyrhynchus TaxID=3082113 RepID=A0AC59Z3I8_RANTA
MDEEVAAEVLRKFPVPPLEDLGGRRGISRWTSLAVPLQSSLLLSPLHRPVPFTMSSERMKISPICPNSARVPPSAERELSLFRLLGLAARDPVFMSQTSESVVAPGMQTSYRVGHACKSCKNADREELEGDEGNPQTPLEPALAVSFS